MLLPYVLFIFVAFMILYLASEMHDAKLNRFSRARRDEDIHLSRQQAMWEAEDVLDAEFAAWALEHERDCESRRNYDLADEQAELHKAWYS